MNYQTVTSTSPEIIIPVPRGILQIPMNSPFIKLIDQNIVTEKDLDWQSLVDSKKTLIFFGQIMSLTIIVQQLLRHGRSSMAHISISGYDANNYKRILTGSLSEILAIALEKNFILSETIVVDNVDFPVRKNFFKKKPLWNKKIVTTRSIAQSYQLVHALESLGAQVYQFPLIKIKPTGNYEEVHQILAQIKNYQWIIFGMNMSVDYFIIYLLGHEYKLSDLQKNKICALSIESGERLADLGLDIHYQPAHFNLDLDKVIEGLQKSGLQKEKPILVVGGKNRGQLLVDKLTALQLEVSFLPLLRTELVPIYPKDIDKLMDFFPIDLLIFNEPYGVKQFSYIWKQIKKELRNTAIAVIGSETLEAVENEGMSVDVVPNEITTASLIDAILDYYDRIS